MENFCPVCKKSKNFEISPMNSLGYSWVDCPWCGLFYAHRSSPLEFSFKVKDRNKLSSYLYYHSQKFISEDRKGNLHYNFLGSKEDFDKKDRPNWTFVTDEIVENWYPKNLNEKVDMILLGLAKQSNYHGSHIVLYPDEILRAFFIDHIKPNGETTLPNYLRSQVNFILSSLHKNHLLISRDTYCLTPEGWNYVDQLQKKQSLASKTVFVSISSGKEMAKIREHIKEAIEITGYEPIIMDEVPHNEQTVLERFNQIQQAKFLIVESTGHNNESYFEAGYALGLKKEIIQVCSKKSFGRKEHFVIQQANTLLWKEESEITQLLTKKIETTIGSQKKKKGNFKLEQYQADYIHDLSKKPEVE